MSSKKNDTKNSENNITQTDNSIENNSIKEKKHTEDNHTTKTQTDNSIQAEDINKKHVIDVDFTEDDKKQDNNLLFTKAYIIDNSNSLEAFRTYIPKGWKPKCKLEWNMSSLAYPEFMNLQALSPNNDAMFEYFSEETFGEIINGANIINHVDGEYSPNTNSYLLRFMPTEDYLDCLLKYSNTNAIDINLVSKEEISNSTLNKFESWLNSQVVKAESALNANKAPTQTEASITDSYIMPASLTYSYTENNIRYKQNLSSCITSMTISFTSKINPLSPTTYSYKLWTVCGLYSYKATEEVYDKYLPAFSVFIDNGKENMSYIDAIDNIRLKILAPNVKKNISLLDSKTLCINSIKDYYGNKKSNYIYYDDGNERVSDLWTDHFYTKKELTNTDGSIFVIPDFYNKAFSNSSGDVYITTSKRPPNGNWSELL